MGQNENSHVMTSKYHMIVFIG